MSDIALHGFVWALVALVTTGVCGLGLALQPLFVLLARRGKGAAKRHVLGAFVGPLLATIVGGIALVVVEHASTETKQTLDSVALLVPVLALAIWVGVSAVLLRPSSAQ
ncbi:hypothetical protein [Sandaracinus amylolyticus]|uniref:Uncharacterized protein n=1 Tax=Sandaracinus amylolyticus TaxID=927083 RepID=A0A0F6W1R3_9BACT|nr:hypothetical protein [Sandaracinus amylolyticus]AKF05211.1 hypothetical protein DB32_002360 [Sandaracinus amylolyticus]